MPAAKRKPAAPLAEPSGKKNSVSGSVSSEEDVFASRVAMHLREFATASETRDDDESRERKESASSSGWTASDVSSAVRDAVAMLPAGSGLRVKLFANLDNFCKLVVKKVTDDAKGTSGSILTTSHVSEKNKKIITEASVKRVRLDTTENESLKLADFARETHRRLLRASFDAPCELAGGAEGKHSGIQSEIEFARDKSLRSAMDAAKATSNKFVATISAITSTYPSDKKQRRDAKKAFLKSQDAKDAQRVVARAFAVAALRRGADGNTDETRAAAATGVLARHAMRRAAENLKIPDHNNKSGVHDTPGRDAALALGNDRVCLIRLLAKQIPDDVSVGGDDSGNDELTHKKKANIVGKYGVKDLPLFEAALGIGGFDEAFERQAVAGSISTFYDVAKPVSVGSNLRGPAVVPRFDTGNNAKLNAGVSNAFQPSATLTEVVRSYENAMAGDPFDDDNEGDDSRLSQENSDSSEEASERLYVASYFDFLKVVRGAAALSVAAGDRRRAENLARSASRASCPAPLLVHLPDSIRTVDPRAASVELAACRSNLWKETITARDETLSMLGGDDDANAVAGFFLDSGAREGGEEIEMDRAVQLAETLGEEGAEGTGLQGDQLTAAEEDDLAAMLKTHRDRLDDDDDPLADLSDEEQMAKELNLTT